MTTVQVLKKELDKIRQQTGHTTRKIQLEVSNRLIKDWSRVIKKGEERSVIEVEA